MVFDSSIARNHPIEFKLNQVIAGWAELSVQTMKVGGKSRFFIPAKFSIWRCGFRRCNWPQIVPLIFDIELLFEVNK